MAPWTWRNVLLAVLLVALMSLAWNDSNIEDLEEQDEYGCICDGAQGECRPHPLADQDVTCDEK